MYIEPHIQSGKLVFECSPKLEEYLKKCANGEYSDEEILALMDAGEM